MSKSNKVIITNQLIPKNEPRFDQYNRQIDDRNSNLPGIFGNFFLTKDIIVEQNKNNNILFLTAGDHKGKTFEKDFTIVKGINSSYFTEPVIVNASINVVFDGITFVEGVKTSDYLVLIKDNAKVIFQNCMFVRINKTNIGSTNTFIRLSATSTQEMVTFSGCIFQQQGATNSADLVGRTDIANGNAYIYNSINTTAIPFGIAVVGVGGNL